MCHVKNCAKRIGGALATVGLCLLWSSLVAALPGDKDQPVEIEADSVDIREGAGISVYQGQVVLTQGSIRLKADKVTVYQRNKQPAKVVAEGRPVRFRQQENTKQRGYVTGLARRAEYQLSSEELVLIGDAELTQGKDSFKSDRIVYDRVKARLKAGAAAQGKQRVKITINNPKSD